MNKNVLIGGIAVLSFFVIMVYGIYAPKDTGSEVADLDPEIIVADSGESIEDIAQMYFPATIPHTTEGRENSCLSCHDQGEGSPISQTTHPERTNCLQCHVLE